MKASIDSLEKQLAGERAGGRNFDSPPLHLWDPPLSGDIDIRIEADGAWYHEGTRIQRDSLVRLFASILRREDDGQYYLVTPVEKWRLVVASHPLLITDVDSSLGEGDPVLEVTLNTGRKVVVSGEHPLFLDDGVAAIRLSHGLTALCSRAAWYRLLDLAVLEDDKARLRSGDFELEIPAA